MFLPHDAAQAAQCRDASTKNCSARACGRRLARVPTDDSVCGQLAKDTLPHIEQVFVDAGGGQDDDAFALALFLARRRAEQACADDRAISTW